MNCFDINSALRHNDELNFPAYPQSLFFRLTIVVFLLLYDDIDKKLGEANIVGRLNRNNWLETESILESVGTEVAFRPICIPNIALLD